MSEQFVKICDNPICHDGHIGRIRDRGGKELHPCHVCNPKEEWVLVPRTNGRHELIHKNDVVKESRQFKQSLAMGGVIALILLYIIL